MLGLNLLLLQISGMNSIMELVVIGRVILSGELSSSGLCTMLEFEKASFSFSYVHRCTFYKVHGHILSCYYFKVFKLFF